jgi:hypothetical protein
VDVSKKLLSQTASLALPFIETPDVKPLDTAPYLNSLTTLQRSTLAAQKVITGISTLRHSGTRYPAAKPCTTR